MNLTLALLAPAVLLAQAGGLALPQIGGTVYSGAGANPDAIRQAVEEFRAALGAESARREINWDGVPDALSSPNELPGDFFAARGAVLSGPSKGWLGFQVSGGDLRFDNLGPGYAQLFQAFSPRRLFSSIGVNDYDVDFFVPGTRDRGSVAGFGAVFVNVAIPTTSSVEFFSTDGVSLGKYYVRAAPRGLSFLGVTFPGRIVAKVRVVPGTAALGEADDPASGVNIAVVDDFLFGEPTRR